MGLRDTHSLTDVTDSVCYIIARFSKRWFFRFSFKEVKLVKRLSMFCVLVFMNRLFHLFIL